jgi:hypothetical protein
VCVGGGSCTLWPRRMDLFGSRGGRTLTGWPHTQPWRMESCSPHVLMYRTSQLARQCVACVNTAVLESRSPTRPNGLTRVLLSCAPALQARGCAAMLRQHVLSAATAASTGLHTTVHVSVGGCRLVHHHHCWWCTHSGQCHLHALAVLTACMHCNMCDLPEVQARHVQHVSACNSE